MEQPNKILSGKVDKVDAVVVGADRVARNGDTANKIGTYQLAVLAKHHGIPFYVVCPVTTIDMVRGRSFQFEFAGCTRCYKSR